MSIEKISITRADYAEVVYCHQRGRTSLESKEKEKSKWLPLLQLDRSAIISRLWPHSSKKMKRLTLQETPRKLKNKVFNKKWP